MFDFLIAVLIVAGVVAIIAGFVVIVSIDINHDEFQKFPKKIKTVDGDVDYNRFLMKFDKWRKLFELDPNKFSFVLENGMCLNSSFEVSGFRITHPCYRGDDGEYYLVDFRYGEYRKYYFYQSKLVDRLSYVSEEMLTKEIIGYIQTKIDEIREEANDQIEKTLNLQEEIILRMESSKSTKEAK